jgi:hypothetical protein
MQTTTRAAMLCANRRSVVLAKLGKRGGIVVSEMVSMVETLPNKPQRGKGRTVPGKI